MWLLVDYKQSLENVDIVVRNHQAAMEVLLVLGHRLTGLVIGDLAEYEFVHGTGGKRKRTIAGHDILMFALVHNVLPLVVQIISVEPVARKRLHNMLVDDAKYVLGINKGRRVYRKPEPEDIVT